MAGPPAYAWDWFARQRLLWRETRRRLVNASYPAAARYHHAAEKGEVILRLREDYPADPVVRDVTRSVVSDLAFLGRTDVPFAELGATNAPRGMRWWWIEITGEEIERQRPPASSTSTLRHQLSLEDVLEGYGD